MSFDIIDFNVFSVVMIINKVLIYLCMNSQRPAYEALLHNNNNGSLMKFICVMLTVIKSFSACVEFISFQVIY